jgi:hypothetical protein
LYTTLACSGVARAEFFREIVAGTTLHDRYPCQESSAVRLRFRRTAVKGELHPHWFD